MKTKLVFLLMLIPFWGLSQSNKGVSRIEVKTALSESNVTNDSKPILGYNLNVGYSYGLIENLDLTATLSSYDAMDVEDIPTFVQQMYFCNAFQLGVRGRLKCWDLVNLKLSLSGGMMVYAYNNIFKVHDVTEMLIDPCISGMAEIDFDISDKVALGVFYGKSIACSSYTEYPYFDSAGISLSLKL